MSPPDRAVADSHLVGCGACSRYLTVVEAGVEQLRSLPAIEPSHDFLPRLQHRLFHIDEEMGGFGQRTGSGTSTGFVLAVLAMMSVAALLPLVHSVPAVVELPAVVVAAPPSRSEAVPALFREGPLLIDDRSRSVYLRFSRLALPVRHQLVVDR